MYLTPVTLRPLFLSLFLFLFLPCLTTFHPSTLQLVVCTVSSHRQHTGSSIVLTTLPRLLPILRRVQFDLEGGHFTDLIEMERLFLPSYPFVDSEGPGDECGDIYGKTRAPAWCDRVLMNSDAETMVRSTSTLSIFPNARRHATLAWHQGGGVHTHTLCMSVSSVSRCAWYSRPRVFSRLTRKDSTIFASESAQGWGIINPSRWRYS